MVTLEQVTRSRTITLERGSVPSVNGDTAHEYSRHLYPQPAPGPALDSSILQIGMVASRLPAHSIFAQSPRNYNGSSFQGHLSRTQGHTFFRGQRAQELWTPLKCQVTLGLSPPPPGRTRRAWALPVCQRSLVAAILQRRDDWPYFTEKEN